MKWEISLRKEHMQEKDLTAEPEKTSKVVLHLWGSELSVDAVVDPESGHISRIGNEQTVFKPSSAPEVLHFDYLGFYESQLKKIEDFFGERDVVVIDRSASRSEDGEDFAGYIEISQGSLNDALQQRTITLKKNDEGGYSFEGLPNE